jgi:flagellin-like protein
MDKKTPKKDGKAIAPTPVVSVLILIAITLSLATVAGSMTYSTNGDMHLVVASAERINTTTIEFTFMGGPDTGSVRYLNATIDGTNVPDTPAGDELSVGSVWSHTDDELANRCHVIVVATFDDGYSQVVLDTHA